MRRLSLTLALVLAALTCSAETWDSIYKARLDASAPYLESGLALKTAEVAYNRFSRPYQPTLTLSTGSGTALGFGSDGFMAGTLTPSLSLENILGADLSIKVPLKASGSGAVSLGDPSLSVTRSLFTETAADRLDAEAAFMTARSAIKKAKDAVRIGLATEILNAMYYKRLLEANRGNLVVLERVRKATVDATKLRELERRVLGAQKSVLIASNALANLGQDVKNDTESLYEDVLRMQATWTKSIEENEPSTSPSIRALELSLEAAEKRKDFSILPYLPNPKLMASLSYDVDAAHIDWGVSVSLSYEALNKGENSLNALRRELNPKILGLKFQDARKGLSDGIRKTKDTLETLELDRKLQNLDIEDARDYVSLFQRLFSGGYASEEDLVIYQIDLSVEELEAQRIAHEILIQKLNLANYYDSEQ
jgi:outer membrane protein TolC